jgi:methionyl-tRNA formyltransferase
MRIVFVGAVDFSRHCLEEVLKQGGEVAAVFTLSEDDAGFHSDYEDLTEVAGRYGVPVQKIKNINQPEAIESIRALAPDVIFVFGWSQLISKTLLAIPPLGCIGSHPALLPRNRGRHPIIWALVHGLEETGLTFFYLDEGADSGDILWQKSLPISLDDDAGSVYAKIKELASIGISEFLPKLQAGVAPRTPQDDSLANYWLKRGEKDGEIDWAASTMTTYNLIRALTHPYVGAHTYLDGHKMTVWRARRNTLELDPSVDPGTVVKVDDGGFDVRTGDGVLTICDYSVPEGRPVTNGASLFATENLNGRN